MESIMKEFLRKHAACMHLGHDFTTSTSLAGAMFQFSTLYSKYMLVAVTLTGPVDVKFTMEKAILSRPCRIAGLPLKGHLAKFQEIRGRHRHRRRHVVSSAVGGRFIHWAKRTSVAQARLRGERRPHYRDLLKLKKKSSKRGRLAVCHALPLGKCNKNVLLSQLLRIFRHIV